MPRRDREPPARSARASPGRRREIAQRGGPGWPGSPSSGRKAGSQSRGFVYVTLRPRFGPKHRTPRCAAVLVSWRQRGHFVLEGVHRLLDRPGPGALADRGRQLVDGQLAPRQGVTDRRDDLIGLLGVNRTGSGCRGTDDGSAERAPVHIGRSAAASRCTVPRGPNVLTRVRSSHSARCTSVRVAPAMRRPIESSAALEDLGVDASRAAWRCRPGSRRWPARSVGCVPSGEQ